MTSKLIRETVAQAKALGLVDVRVVPKRRHAFLVARHPQTGKQVSIPLSKGSHHARNPYLPDQITTALRRQMR
jgi:hypothetical protein